MRAAALAPSARPGLTLATASVLALAALTGAGLLGAAAAMLTGASHTDPHDAITDSPPAVASLFLHNAAVAGIPLALAGLGWDRGGLAAAGDLVIGASLAANGAVVGWAAARSGPGLAAYLPHLPFEWSAIALSAGAWLCLRSGHLNRRALLLQTLGLTAGALLIAAVIEVYAAPLG